MWTFETLVNEPAAWLGATGPHSGVVLSTRVRLARNLADEPFPNRADVESLARVRESVLAAVAKSNYLANALVLDMEKVVPAMREVLVERHITSHGFGRTPTGRAVVIGEREVMSGMVNEEDHLRLQCIRSGLEPVDAWRLVERLDSQLDQNLHYAYSSDWGYLTACPTNVGTGIRVSVLVHLAGLVRSGRVARVLGSVSKLGLTVRGFYGEGSAALGGFFQVSNQTTLGQSEEDIAYTVERVAGKLAVLEDETREALLSNRRVEIEDEVHRAHAVLSSARLLSADEAMRLCSSLRLGVATEILSSPGLAAVNRLLVVTQPGHLEYGRRGDASAPGLDELRAGLARRELARPNT